jgi:acyl dehydratase
MISKNMEAIDNKLKSPPEVGKEVVFNVSEGIGKRAIRRFASVIGDGNPLYYDEEYARKTPYKRIIAPPTMLFEIGFDIGDDINGKTGLQVGLEEFLGFPDNIQRVGNEYEIFEPLYPDDIIKAKRRITSVEEKEGKTGKWIFITSEIIYLNQEGKILGKNKETVACRY